MFQNRYKSILCQDDPYLLELVRYIHLNPLRAGLVDIINQLDKFAFSGHAVLMGKHDHLWQQTDEVLVRFSEKKDLARRRYKAFLAKGVDQGLRDDLTGGGLVRSAGGWAAVSAMRKAKIHEKSDEWILGDGDFVGRIPADSNEVLDRRTALKNKGVDVEYITEKVAGLLNMTADEIWLPGRTKRLVKARSIVCYWAVRDLGESMASMARRFNISAVAVGKAVQRGAGIAKEEGLELL